MSWYESMLYADEKDKNNRGEKQWSLEFSGS